MHSLKLKYFSIVFLILLCHLTLSDLAIAQRFRAEKHIPYLVSQPQNFGHTLDIYAPRDAHDLPVVIFIHGGAWKLGDKMLVDRKPGYLTQKGYLLVSINYRLHDDQISVLDQTADVTAAINWVHDHIGRFGGNPQRLILMGHSAGAHLTALASIKQQSELPRQAIEGIILVDGACYDVQENIKQTPKLVKNFFELVFTKELSLQISASPQSAIQAGMRLPPFLIIHADSEFESKNQAELLTNTLHNAGIAAELYEARNENHNSVNMNIGWPQQPTTQKIDQFLERIAPQ